MSAREMLTPVCVVLTTFIGLQPARAANLTALPESGHSIDVMQDGETYLELNWMGWGPGWQFLGLRGQLEETADASRLTSSAVVRSSGATVTYDMTARRSQSRQLAVEGTLTTDKATDLVYMVAAIELPDRFFKGGHVIAVDGTGKEKQVSLPVGRGTLGTAVRELRFVDGVGRQSSVTLSPPIDVATDGAIRLVLAKDRLSAHQECPFTITLDLPDAVTYFSGPNTVPDTPGQDEWFAFHPTRDHNKPSEIGMADWLDKPAGKHGRIHREKDRLIYDGRPIKLWGLNVCYSSCAPDKELADQRADFYAKYGINTVRLHKYADGTGWAGIQAKDSFVEFNPDALDRMDYFVSRLKQKGIYVLLSSTFGVKLGPADRQYVPFMDEFGKSGQRVATGHGSIFLCRELQDLQIKQMTKLLSHQNPYTGLTYAQDPCVAVVELFNEDSALFFGTLSTLQRIPTLRRRASEHFCQWLGKRYGDKKTLLDAWGKAAINSFGNEGFSDESWEKQSIVPAGNPWFFDPDQLADSQKVKRRRLLDTMRFLYDIQNDFYGRYVAAIRSVGYDGEILGSNWQAGRAFSHYYNLHSDSLVGLIDRHNYFGGGSGAKINNASMLRIPGSGMLSAGMQQVSDRPFMLSEWIHVAPTEWGMEGPAIIGAYGMGLQGWDVSYMFQNRDSGGFLNQIGKDRWEVTAPQVLAVFPAVARQVLRGDIRQSDVVATRRVHIPSLEQGRLDFEDKVTQQHDVKTFNCDKVPVQTLAVARSVVEFTDQPEPTPIFDISKYQQGNAFVSSTNELVWHAGSSKLDGFFTINTDATKAVVGFADGKTCELGDVTIESKSRFAGIYVTAQERDATIASSRSLLIVAVARARNTGMKVFEDCRVLNRGTAPVIMEPVKARITLRKHGTPAVFPLDHDGSKTDQQLSVTNGVIEIDGVRDRTCYYKIEY